jgi:hypothetical protein
MRFERQDAYCNCPAQVRKAIRRVTPKVRKAAVNAAFERELLCAQPVERRISLPPCSPPITWRNLSIQRQRHNPRGSKPCGVLSLSEQVSPQKKNRTRSSWGTPVSIRQRSLFQAWVSARNSLYNKPAAWVLYCGYFTPEDARRNASQADRQEYHALTQAIGHRHANARKKLVDAARAAGLIRCASPSVSAR